MLLSNFDRIIVMAVDKRYPEHPHRTVQGLLNHGADRVHVCLNGRGTKRLDRHRYNLFHEGEPPATWTHSRELWDHFQTYRWIVRKALQDGVERLLITEDDIEFSPNFDAITARARVPDDWQMIYFFSFRYWETCEPEVVAPYILRANGGQCGTQAIGWGRKAMEAFLELPVDRPTDWAVACLHGQLPCYLIEPSVIRHRDDVPTSTG